VGFLDELDGSVKLLPLPATEGAVYPARFRIPPDMIHELDCQERFRRAERLPMASLLYEILSGKKPLEELAEEEIQ